MMVFYNTEMKKMKNEIWLELFSNSLKLGALGIKNPLYKNKNLNIESRMDVILDN